MVYYDKYVAEREMAKSGVGWFKFDESSGNVTDSKGTAVGTVNGGVDRVLGVSGNALSFNGTTGYVQFNQKVLPVGKKSIRFKIKTTSSTVEQIIFTQTAGTANSGTQVWVLVDGVLNVLTGFGTAGQSVLNVSSRKKIDDNQWHDVLITWDGTTNDNGVKIYIDDMRTPDVTATANRLESNAPSFDLRLGRGQSTVTFWFKGQLDELEIYNDVIDPFSYKSFILKELEYNNRVNGKWNAVSSTLPTLTQFQNEGIDDLSTLDRKVQLVDDSPQIMIDQGVLGAGKVFKGTVDLAKYFDLRKLEVK